MKMIKTTCLTAAALLASALVGTDVAAGQKNRPDSWITTKVKTTLAMKKDVKAVGTNVDTSNGVVTLNGEAENLAERELTERYVREIEGVRGVNNRLTLRGGEPADEPAAQFDGAGDRALERADKASERFGEKMEGSGDRALSRIDDAALTGRVKSALAANRATRAIGINVDTAGGRVTLKGKVDNAAEKSLSERVALDVKGVKSVANQLVVHE